MYRQSSQWVECSRTGTCACASRAWHPRHGGGVVSGQKLAAQPAQQHEGGGLVAVQQQDGGDEVEALAVADLRLVQRVGEEHPPQRRDQRRAWHTHGRRLCAHGCRLGARGCRLGAHGCRLSARSLAHPQRRRRGARGRCAADRAPQRAPCPAPPCAPRRPPPYRRGARWVRAPRWRCLRPCLRPCLRRCLRPPLR
eukprot:scaffold36945_cov56-Phaeocystis_antarctica.AAC.1